MSDKTSESGRYGAERPVGQFASALEECRSAIAKLTEAVDDHLGVSPDEVSWGHVADAERLLRHLQHAAFVAGVGAEPLD